MTDTFQLTSTYALTGDQPQAVDSLTDGVLRGDRYQTLLGVTGSGKTFTMANVIARANRPTLVIAHNKTLAAQLCNEFREFLPDAAVEYFVSYYDYYQPEAYVPQQDLYIEKDSSINDEIDRLRHAATNALLMRRDVVIVASVSCIFGLGSPDDYLQSVVLLRAGDRVDRDALLRKLVDIQYQRNDYQPTRGKFRVRGDVIEIQPAYEETAVRIELFGDDVEAISVMDPLTGEKVEQLDDILIFAKTHYVVSDERLQAAIGRIE
ncbi:MAG TPA: DEAD/DEAH box helicase family protein, partial [Thermoleophilia bacterium]|nr:DEAD/DEAH box helicase family protein [Thermoleophilia bacterium]